MAAADTAPLLRRRAAAPPAPPAEALPFLEEIERLAAEPAPAVLRLWPWAVGAMFAALLGFSALWRVDMVVVAPGRLMPDAPPLVLQPFERAVLREVLVRPGDTVREGEVVARLDPSFALADRDALASQRRTLAAMAARLEAELAGAPPVPAMDSEGALQALLQSRRAALLAARREALESEARALRAGLRATDEAEASLAEQLAMAREVEALRARLLEGQLNSRLQYLAARSARVAAEGERQRNAARREELRHALSAKAAELQAAEEDWRRQVLEELVRVRAELARAEEALSKAERLAALTELRAPRDGVVLEVVARAPGSVLRDAEPVVTLVPLGAPLIAEVALRSADTGRLAEGAPVVVKVDAFPFQRHGGLEGRLRAVARDSAVQGGEARHRAQVEIPSARLRTGEAPMTGMTVTAEVKVGERSVLAYFLDPLLRGFGEALREP
jgi:HlyD family secretion protein